MASGLADLVIKKTINDQVASIQDDKHASDAYKDKGEGVKKPPKSKGDTEPDKKEKFAKKDLEYPKLELMICKRGKLKPKEGQKASSEEVIAYLDGAEGC